METKAPKFTLNLNETNSLGFTITIEGSSSDVESTKPEFRFVLAERGSEKAWLYPMEKDEEGDMVVQIPPENIFSEKREYRGHVEVILGNHYFVPTAVDIEFVRPLKVEASVATKKSNVFKEGQEGHDSKPLSISSVTVKTKNKLQKRTPSARKELDNSKPHNTPKVNEHKQTKRSWDELSITEQEKIKKVLRERKLAELRRAKRSSGSNNHGVNSKSQAKVRTMKKVESSIKEQLKSLMADSLIED